VVEEGDARVESAADRAFKRRFGGKDKGRNKRDDYALDLFREASAYLHDPERVNRILRELGKLYNPVVDGPIVDLPTRQRIMACLHAGRRDEANRILAEQRRLYAPNDDGENSGIHSQEQWDTP
jgi:hypothetical protein